MYKITNYFFIFLLIWGLSSCGGGEPPEPNSDFGGDSFSRDVENTDLNRPYKDMGNDQLDLSNNEDTSEAVRSHYMTQQQPIYELSLLNEQGEVSVLDTTANHPFYVNGRGWTRVDELTTGNLIEAKDSAVEIIEVNKTNRVEDVYNFGVDDAYSYFVGEVEAWVHNSGDCDPLSLFEIKKLKKAGFDIHDIKEGALSSGAKVSRFDLFRKKATDIFGKRGDILVKPKSGIGPGAHTGLNIDDF